MREYFDSKNWVLLYSSNQDAYHVETEAEYKSKPANGYTIVSRHVIYADAANAGRKQRQKERS